MIATDTKPTESMKKRSDAPGAGQSHAIDTLVLAGARATGDALAEAHCATSKAEIKVAGRSMINWVLDAVKHSQMTGLVTIIGLDDPGILEADQSASPIEMLDAQNGPAESVYHALNPATGEQPVLVTTCDHVLLTPEILDIFLAQSIASKADLTVALAQRDLIEASYPEAKRTYLKFGDGHYSSCNLFCFVSPAAREVARFWQDAEKDRKRPWRIAWKFGLIRALRILIGRPTHDKVFQLVSERLGVNIQPVILPFADAAVDVDTEDDLALVERVLKARSQ